VAQDPEAVRTAACKLVANDATCTTVTVRPPDTGRPSVAAAGFNLVSLLFWVALFVALVLVAVIVARAVARRQSRRDDEPAEDDGDALIEEVAGVIVDRRREPVDWRRAADRHRAAGRFRDALRCRYRALVGDLARRGLIDEIPGRTTGEERAQLRAVAPPAAAPFDQAADLFDAVWYGDAAADEADDDRFAALDRAVLAAAVRVPA
jgi:hypothetical protein